MASASEPGSLTLAGNSMDSSLPERDPDFGVLKGGEKVDRYMILNRLGSGAMGVVYAAYDAELDRKIALKLLHPSRLQADELSASGSARARLLREAKALARLSHPNVVAIHDVGVYRDQIFLAMEFVNGLTLSKWIKAAGAPRPWTDVITVMLNAGEGLAAAHDAGLVHRDFKPDNVLIGEDDGRVRVLDFGLARSEDAPDEERPSGVDPVVDSSTGAELRVISAARAALRVSASELGSADSEGLTHTGALVGTPAYMSPEQHMGEPADARSDQFSFCVTLYQALYGQRPFTGDTLNGLAFNVLQGKVRPAPAKSRVPSHLRKVVLRGLAVDPKERYPSMRELLGALAPVSSSVRTRWLWAAAGGALAVGVAVGGAAVSRESPCSGAAERLENIWDAPRRNAIASAFAATELPYATSTWDHVADDLDAYARRWIDGYTDACEATRRGDQSPALLDRRMLCFDRGRTELRALSDGFAKADAQVVENAREGAAALPRLDVCDDTKALLAAVPPPAGDAARAQEQQIRERLAEARVHDLRGEWATAFEMTQAAVEDAAALEYPPL
ncbi:MAG: serine/threonine protein kinase, partial [Myxococcales bacterium]|nr:serine/threonine protein kinase [Myxococcales bacterium]